MLIPPAVHRELLHPGAPRLVWEWTSDLANWVEIRPPKDTSRFSELGPGEREAISVALEAKADFLLIDESLGPKMAVQHGVPVKGTLGVLEQSARRRLVDLPDAIGKLKATGIFLSDDLVQKALDRHRDRRRRAG